MTRIALTIAAGLSALAAALPGGAAAALPYSQAMASCSNWQDGVGTSIVVSAPDMSPLGNLAIVPGVGLVVNPPQTVGFRVTIARLGASGWYAYSTGPLMTTTVSGWASTVDLPWLNTSTNRLEDAGRRFWIFHPGSYRVWVDYVWYANRYFGPASTGAYLNPVYGGASGICRF